MANSLSTKRDTQKEEERTTEYKIKFVNLL